MRNASRKHCPSHILYASTIFYNGIINIIYNLFRLVLFYVLASSFNQGLDRFHGANLDYLNKQMLIDCMSDLKNTAAGLDELLSRTIRYGIAFHHAGT
jgi:hypothetical protein